MERYIFKGIRRFSFLPELSENYRTIFFVPLAPCSMIKYAVLPAMFVVANLDPRLSQDKSPLYAKGTPRSFWRKFSPVFAYKWEALLNCQASDSTSRRRLGQFVLFLSELPRDVKLKK